jgi:DNA mismatch repair protein MutL
MTAADRRAATRPEIAVLPSDVADRIAAGEVVERPASVVKELVENALDAGATTVDIDIREGGRASIRVSDDGHGMDAANATRAVLRHATSKIRDAEDLVGVASFGFRGEALPAIGSVAILTIETATADGDGVRVVVDGGAPPVTSPVARRRGTTVMVDRLFFNTPARQKFMRGARAEWRAVSEIVTTMALVRREVRLSLRHDGKEQWTLPASPDVRARVAPLWGRDVADRFVTVEDVTGTVRVSGIVERPSDVGTAARRVFLMVNGRAIRDTGLVRAAESAYRTTIPAGVRPSLLLEVALPGRELDVNVHPAKAEVRFADRWSVERAVERAVRRALGTEDAAAVMGTFTPAPAAVLPLGTVTEPEVLRTSGSMAPAPLFDALPASEAVPFPAPRPEDEFVVPPLVQLHRTYLAFEREDALVLIDQHSAHERVLYERFLQGF